MCRIELKETVKETGQKWNDTKEFKCSGRDFRENSKCSNGVCDT
jgi:hypothetical protein